MRAAVMSMPCKGGHRSVLVAAIVLFLAGFSYGVYRSFTAMEGTRHLEQLKRDLEPPQAMPGDVHNTDLLIDLLDAESQHDAAPPVYYLGVYEDKVAVFVGPPAGGRVVRVTERRLDTLPPQEVALLRSGIRVDGESEMLKALEGYMQ